MNRSDERDASNRLDDRWDQLQRGRLNPAAPENTDAPLLVQLHAGDDTPGPDAGFARQLEERLMAPQSFSAGGGLMPPSAGRFFDRSVARAAAKSKPVGRRSGVFSSVMLLCLIVLTGYAAFRFSASEERPGDLAAQLAATPGARACSIPPPAAAPPAPTRGDAPPAPVFPFNVNRQLLAGPLPMSAVPTGAPAAAASDRRAIVEAVGQLQACATLDGDHPSVAPRILSLFSPGFFQRGLISVMPNPWWDAYPLELDWGGLQLDPASIETLPDGRIRVLLDPMGGDEYVIALVFTASSGGWLIDETAAIESGRAAPTPPSQPPCTLPAPTLPIQAPDFTAGLSHPSALPSPRPAKQPEGVFSLPLDETAAMPSEVMSSDLPSTAPASDAVQAGLVSALTDVTGCQQVIDESMRADRSLFGYSRSMERYSDDFLRRFAPTNPAADRWYDGYRFAFTLFGSQLPEIQSVGLLPDGRALAILQTSVDNRQRYAVVFAETGGRWLLDEIATITEPAAATPTSVATPGPANQVVIVMEELVFRPSQITVPAGETVTVTLWNKGAVTHSFVIDALGVHQEVAAGESVNLRIIFPAGVSAFYCAIPGHKAAGMVGTITAVLSATPAAS